jgi:PAS domain S-box-containing protein
MRRIQHRPRRLVVAAVVIIVAAWFAVCAWLTWLTYQAVLHATTEQLAAQQMTLAAQAARSIEDNIAHLRSDLELLAGDDRIADMSPQGISALRRYLDAHRSELQSVTRMSAEGIILTTLPNRASEGSFIGGQPHVQRLLETRQPVLSDAFTSVQGYRSIAIHVPVYRAGLFAGSIAILIPLDYIAEQFLAGIRVGNYGYAWVVSRDGIEIYCANPDHVGRGVLENGFGTPEERSLASAMVHGDLGTAAVSRDHASGQPIRGQITYRPIKLLDNQWSIAIAAPQNEILEMMRGFLKPFILTIAVLLVGIAAILLLAFRLQLIARERRVREQADARYRLLVEQLPAINYSVDLGEHRTVYISPQVERILGFSPEEWTSDPERWLRQVHPDDRERVASEVRRNDETGVPAGLEYRVITRSGELRWLHNLSTYVRDPAGRVLAVNGVMLDITERRTMEDALRDRDERLLQSQKLEAVGRLAGGVAHDFNNLLTVIRGYAELLNGEPGIGDPQRLYAREIVQATVRAQSLTDQLLAYSRKQMRSPQPLDLNIQVSAMEAMLRRLIGEHIQLATRLDPQLPIVRADPGQIEQVLMNLAVNARDSMPEGGTLTIATSTCRFDAPARAPRPGLGPGAWAVLEVADTGLGMDEETFSHLFEPFFTTKEKGKGTGLGLSTVYGIVAQSGGSIFAESAPGAGARFTIYLPAIEGEAPRTEQPRTHAPPARGNGRILLVEDEAKVRDLARSIIAQAGYTVREAQNGREALALYATLAGPVDLLVTDVIMPEMGGVELAKRLSAIQPGLRVIYLSGYTDDALGSHGVLEPGINFLRKPFNAAELLARIGESLATTP